MLATGGTGGHVFPAQALAQELAARNWRVVLLTDGRGLTFLKSLPDTVSTELISAATFSRGGLLSRLAAPPRILGGILSSLIKIGRNSPRVVVGFGGYTSFPAVAAALTLRKPCLIHEQNGCLGKANRMLSRHVDVVACGTRSTDLPEGVRGVYTGNPVRREIICVSQHEYRPPQPGKSHILVLGGSQGADILDRIVPDAIAGLPQEWHQGLRIVQQTRPENIAAVREHYAQLGITFQVDSFFDDVPAHLASTQLVISRAGASSLAELTTAGRPAVLVPFAAAANDHQSENARALVEAGAAMAIDEHALTAARLSEMVLQVLAEPQIAARMAKSSRQCAATDAASRLADQVERLARGERGQ